MSRKVLHVIANISKGGAEKQMCLLANTNPAEHVVAVMHEPEIDTTFQVCRVSRSNVLAEARKFLELIDLYQITIVQLWLPFRFTFSALIAAKIRKLTVISCERRQPRESGWGFFYDRMNYLNHFFADHIVSNFPYFEERSRLSWLFGHKSLVIPNAIATGSNDLRNLEKIPSKLLFVGRLHRQKNIIEIIKQSDDLFLENAIDQILIIGDGPERSTLEKHARSKKSNIVFIPHCDQWVKKFEPKEYLFILPSFFEGMPNVVFEAIDAGFLCILSDLKIYEYVFRKEMQGLFILSENSKKSICEAVQRIILSDIEELNRARKNLKKHVAGFTISKMENSYESLYRKYERTV